MNKNLKRVISAASALAVTASGVAAFAVSYPDVPETAEYNQAVTELSALGVISGFEDGTFRPDENVTRAQITKMVVTALGNTAVSQADASAGRDTQFADVPGSHWASGFVAVGTSSTASNFINGYSQTVFGPEDNVTYAQAVKMVVAALGYTTLAEGQGGWPSGYLKYGYQLGIATLSGVGNDDQLNRGQVAIIIDNALKCPICVANGYTYDSRGRQIPNTLIKDGTGDLDDTKDGYQNLLNYAHDAYLVYGRVKGTFRSGANVDPDEVRFAVEKADNWDGYELNAGKNDDADEITTYKGQVTDADDYLFTYSQAIIQKDRNDEYTLISLTPYGASEIITLDASDYKKITEANNDFQVQMYKDAGHSRYDTYKVNLDAEMYVNGREVSGTMTDFFNGTYVSGNQVGKVTFIDATDEGKSSTDGKYDYVMVSYYVDGVVEDVDTRSDEVTINLSDTDTTIIRQSKVVLDYDDEDKDYNITLNGETIAATDLQENDVLSIAYDVNKAFKDSDTYDIFVSRDTVEGKVSSVYTDPDDTLDNEYTLDNGNVYKIAYDGAATLKSGDSYTLYIDAFGKVAKAEDLVSSKKFAVLENVYKTNGDADSYVDILTGTGAKVAYQIKNEDFDEFVDILMEDAEYFNSSAKGEHRKQPWDRVITYTLTTKGELRLKDAGAQSTDSSDNTSFDGEYKSSTQKLAGKQLSEAMTQIIDLSEYKMSDFKSYSSVALNDFIAGNTYEGYAYGKTGSNNTYQFVIVTKGIGGFNVDNNWAVFVQRSNVETENNGDQEAVQAYVGGKLTTLPLDTSACDDMEPGDVFFYKTNSDGEIDEVRPVTDDAMFSGKSYRELYAAWLEDDDHELLNATTLAQFASEDGAVVGEFAKSDNVNDCEIVSGPLVNVSNGDVSIASKKEMNRQASATTYFEIDKVKTYELAEDANVYVYDYSTQKAKERVIASTRGSVGKSNFDSFSYVGKKADNIVNFENELLAITYQDPAAEDGLKFISNSNYGNVNFAVAKVVDGDITEILVVMPDGDED